MTALALATPLAACVTSHSIHESEPDVPEGFNFAYSAEHQEAIGLIQVFDDGQRTYLQFKDRSPYLAIEREGGGLIPVHQEPPYVVLEGVYERLALTDDQSNATVVNAQFATVPPVPRVAAYPVPAPSPPLVVADEAFAPLLAHVGIPESQQTMSPALRVSQLNREIGELEEGIQVLAEELAGTQIAGGAPNLAWRSDFAQPRFVIRFDDLNDAALIEPAILKSLGSAARAANRIYLHAHTDAYVASDAGTDLAIRRGVAVRELLASQSVETSRMRIFYRGAGNFMANNSTPQGKAQNRRVEIEFRKW